MPFINVRWADNTSQLKANLKSGVDQIEVTRASVDKLTRSLGGENVVAAAHKYAAAVAAIGGAANLTAANQARVNAVMTKAVDVLNAAGKGGSDLAKHFQSLADQTQHATKAGDELNTRMVALGATIGTVAGNLIVNLLGALKDVSIGLVKELGAIALHGAAVGDVEENFKRLTTQAGLLGDQLLGTLRTGTHNTITDFELMTRVNQNLAAGMHLTEQQYGVLTKGAFALAQATGVDVKQALDTMNDAMLTGRTRAIAMLTGKIDLTKAEADFAKSIGSTADHLNEEGKLEAARIAILKQVGDATERLGDQTDGLDEKVQQAQVAWKNFKEELGKTLAQSTVLGTGLDGLKDILAKTFGGDQRTQIDGIAHAIEDLEIKIVEFAKAGVEGAGFLIKEYYAVKKVFGDLLQVIDLARLAQATGILPGQADPKKALELIAAITARGAALDETNKAQARVDVSVAALNTRLDELKAKMQAAQAAQDAARQAAADFVGPLQDEATEARNAAQAQADHAKFLQQSTAEKAKAKAAAEQLAKVERELASLNADYRETLKTIQPALVEEIQGWLRAGASIDQLAVKYPKLTKAQLKAVADLDKALDATLKSMEKFEDIGVAAAQAVGKSLSGMKTLRTLAQGMGASAEDAADSYVVLQNSLKGLDTTVVKFTLDSKELPVIGALIETTYHDAGDAIVTAMTDGARAHLSLNKEQRETINQMLDLGFSIEEIAKRLNLPVALIKQATKASGDFADALGDVGNILYQLSQIGDRDSVFNVIVGQIGVALKAVEQLQQALRSVGLLGAASKAAGSAGSAADGITTGVTGGLSAAAIGSLASAYVGLAIALISVAQAIQKANQKANDLKVALHFKTDLDKDFHTTAGFSDELAQTLLDLQQQIMRTLTAAQLLAGGNDPWGIAKRLAESLKINEVIAELGGIAHLTGDQMKYVEDRVSDLFGLIAQGGKVGLEATKALDTVLSDMGTSATKSGGLVSKFFLDMIKKAQAAGIELEKVNEFLLNQTRTNIIGGLSGFLSQGKDAKATLEEVRKKMADIKAERDDLIRRGTLGVSDSARLKELNKQWADLQEQAKKASGVIAGTAIKTQEAAYALGATVFAAFDQMRKAGVPISEIMAQLGPVIEDLQAKFEAAGFDGGAAFNSIRSMAALAKDEIAGPIISGINGLGQALAGLHNIGALDQNTFAGLTQQITGMYQSLVKQGKGGVDALRLLQQPLQTIWALHKDTGLAIDEATQALLDEAEANGIVGEKMRPIQEKQLIATERIADAVEKIGELFGVLPKKAEDAAKGITDGLAKIKIPKVDIAYRYYQEGDGPPDSGGTYGGERPYDRAATGGIVTPHGIQRLATGGMVQSTGPDTIPALLSVGELVLNKQQQQAMLDMLQAGVAMAELVNATRAATQNTTTINITPPVANASTSIAPMPGTFPIPVPSPDQELPSMKWDVIDAWMVELIDAIRQLTNTLRSVELPQLQPLPLPFPTPFPFPINQPAPPLPLPGPIRYFAEGGIVSSAGFPGHPKGRDTKPAWLEVGESVLTKEATQRIGPERILAINAGKVDHLSTGGTIGPLLPRNVIPFPTGEWSMSNPIQERVLITELQANTRVVNQFITAATGTDSRDQRLTTQVEPRKLVLEVDGREIGYVVFDPQNMSGNVRERARLQVQQLVKEK